MDNDDNDRASGGDELSSHSAANVADLLALPEFVGTEVIAGRAGLGRVVSRANVMEVPDIEGWVQPQELLLTTGYPLRDVPQGLAHLVSVLNTAGVSALGVKLHRYLDELPADMIRAAEHAKLPLLLLPESVAFADLLNAVLRDSLGRQAVIPEVTAAIELTLIPLVLRGGGLGELVDAVATLVAGPTFVSGTDGRLLAASGDDETRSLLEQPDLFLASGRFRAERFPSGVHRVGDLTLTVESVLAGAEDHGRLVAVHRGAPSSTGDRHLLQRAAPVAALVITKARAVEAVEAKYRGDFIRDVLLDRAGPRDVVVAHCESLGWDVARPLVVAVSALDPLSGGDASPGDSGSQDRFATAWDTAVAQHDPASPVARFAREVVALVGIPPGRSPRDHVADLVQRVSGHSSDGRRSFTSGVSRVVTDPSGIPAGYDQARRAVHVGRQLHGSSAVFHFDDLGAFRLLSLIDDAQELRNFAAEVLGELSDESDPLVADMRATLRVLLDTNFNVAESSRRLHFHYNTLRYRIGKLEQLLGRFTSDPDLQLDLALALRIMQMRDL